MIPAKFLKSIEGTTNLYEIRVEHNGTFTESSVALMREIL